MSGTSLPAASCRRRDEDAGTRYADIVMHSAERGGKFFDLDIVSHFNVFFSFNFF